MRQILVRTPQNEQFTLKKIIRGKP